MIHPPIRHHDKSINLMKRERSDYDGGFSLPQHPALLETFSHCLKPHHLLFVTRSPIPAKQ
jgi:hypothetical protein